MDNISKEELPAIFECSSEELQEFMGTKFGEQTLEFLASWATVTQKSLLANRMIITTCLQTDEEGHVLCRFCGEGIPNWKQEDSREHLSDCPINFVSDALIATSLLKKDIVGLTNIGQ